MNPKKRQALKTHRAVAWLLIALFGVIGGAEALAQTFNSTVTGSVKDQAGAVIVGAKVTLIDLATQREVTATTNDQGVFVFPEVRAGNYKLVAERDGFKKGEVAGMTVNADAFHK